MVLMELFEIRIDETKNEQLIVLKEKGGTRLLHIAIGVWEAQAIQLKVHKITVPRPMTHDLLNSVIISLGGRLQRIFINNLKDSTFHAKLLVETENGIIEIDSRPSDAIALAVRAGSSIYVAENEVLDKIDPQN